MTAGHPARTTLTKTVVVRQAAVEVEMLLLLLRLPKSIIIITEEACSLCLLARERIAPHPRPPTFRHLGT